MTIPPPELSAYVHAPDPSTSWKLTDKSARRLDLTLISQTWQGQPWTHSIVVVWPERVDHQGAAIFYLTGGDPNPLDLAEAQALADLSGMPVAHVFGIPNQPLWDRMEDDLIAHTFEQFLDTGDPSWPLLFPMTKAAIHAMDALQDLAEIDRFVVTGGSKRGWTAWLAAATGDPRIVGFAPMVFDNLNFEAQMRHQMELWGHYSPMIADYTDRDLQEKTETPLGKRLETIVDPYSYLSAVKAPVLIVNGANDEYWAADAMNLYWRRLSMPKAIRIVPNVDHVLGDKLEALAVIGAFGRSCMGEFAFPHDDVKIKFWNGRVEAISAGEQLKIWRADSESLLFTDCAWIDEVKDMITLGGESNHAVFAEATYRFGRVTFRLTSPALIVPRDLCAG